MKNETSIEEKPSVEEAGDIDEIASVDTSAGDQKSDPLKKPIFDKSVINDVPVTLNAFLGSSEMTVSDLMDLRDGAVITLDASLNHLADLRLNDRTIARGEIVAVGKNFGIRITEISV